MSDLQIPAEAEAVAHAFGVSPQILADTAPFIVAAELRRLAAVFSPGPVVENGAWSEDHADEARHIVAALRRRADELEASS